MDKFEKKFYIVIIAIFAAFVGFTAWPLRIFILNSFNGFMTGTRNVFAPILAVILGILWFGAFVFWILFFTKFISDCINFSRRNKKNKKGNANNEDKK